MRSFHSKPNPLYRFLKQLSASSSVPHVVYNSISAADLPTKVDLFNTFFNSVFTQSDFVLPPISQMPIPSVQLPCIEITSDDVYSHLLTLDTSKATGCDSLSVRVLKLCAGSIVDPVTALLKECLTSGCLPDEWKIHKVDTDDRLAKKPNRWRQREVRMKETTLEWMIDSRILERLQSKEIGR